MIMLTKHLFTDIALKNRFKTLVLYATETGRSKNYAGIVNEIFSHAFDSRVRILKMYHWLTITAVYTYIHMCFTRTPISIQWFFG